MHCEGLLMIGLIENDLKNQTLLIAKMAKTDTLFMAKTAEKTYPLVRHIPT